MSTRCLVVSNCQTVGLARSLSLICPGLEVVGIDIWQFVRECSAERMWSEYDILVTLPDDSWQGGSTLQAGNGSSGCRGSSSGGSTPT